MNILEQLDHPGFKPSKSDRTLMESTRLHSDLFCTTPIASLAKKISNPSAPGQHSPAAPRRNGHCGQRSGIAPAGPGL